MRQTQLAIHHTAVKRTGQPQILGVHNYHAQKWGSLSSLGWFVGYNYFVDVDGFITQCRTLDEETIANKGHNCDVPERCDTVSVCFALDGATQVFNKGQEDAFRTLRDKYKGLKLVLHREIQANRPCPGALITQEYLQGLLSDDPDNTAEKQEEIKRLRSTIKALLFQVVTLLQQKIQRWKGR